MSDKFIPWYLRRNAEKAEQDSALQGHRKITKEIDMADKAPKTPKKTEEKKDGKLPTQAPVTGPISAPVPAASPEKPAPSAPVPAKPAEVQPKAAGKRGGRKPGSKNRKTLLKEKVEVLKKALTGDAKKDLEANKQILGLQDELAKLSK